MTRSSLVVFLVLLASACTGSRRTGPRGDGGTLDGGGSDSATDAAIEASSDTRPALDAPACLTGTTRVEVDLTIMIEDGCAIWNSLDLLAGEATITRDGDSLTIDFGDGVVFTGTVSGDTVSLTYVHPHEFTDGCGWEATETLLGTFRSDCALTLAYDYVETVAIDRGGCATPCSAEADVTIELTPLI